MRKGAERGKEDGKTRQVWHYSCTTPVTECCWAKSRRQIRFRGKALLPPPTVTYVERITNHYNHLSSPCGPWNIPLLMKLYCKIAEYKCFALFRSGSCKTLWALSMTSPSSDRAGSLLSLRGFVRKHCDLKRKGERNWKVPCSPQTAQNNPEEFIAGSFVASPVNKTIYCDKWTTDLWVWRFFRQ